MKNTKITDATLEALRRKAVRQLRRWADKMERQSISAFRRDAARFIQTVTRKKA